MANKLTKGIVWQTPDLGYLIINESVTHTGRHFRISWTEKLEDATTCYRFLDHPTRSAIEKEGYTSYVAKEVMITTFTQLVD